MSKRAKEEAKKIVDNVLDILEVTPSKALKKEIIERVTDLIDDLILEVI